MSMNNSAVPKNSPLGSMGRSVNRYTPIKLIDGEDDLVYALNMLRNPTNPRGVVNKCSRTFKGFWWYSAKSWLNELKYWVLEYMFNPVLFDIVIWSRSRHALRKKEQRGSITSATTQASLHQNFCVVLATNALVPARTEKPSNAYPAVVCVEEARVLLGRQTLRKISFRPRFAFALTLEARNNGYA